VLRGNLPQIKPFVVSPLRLRSGQASANSGQALSNHERPFTRFDKLRANDWRRRVGTCACSLAAKSVKGIPRLRRGSTGFNGRQYESRVAPAPE